MMRIIHRKRGRYEGSHIADLHHGLQLPGWLWFAVVCVTCSCTLASCATVNDTIAGRWTGEFYDRRTGVPVVMVLRQDPSGEIQGKVISLAGQSYVIHGAFQGAFLQLIFPQNEVLGAVVHGGNWKGSTVFQGHRWYFAFSRS